MSGTKYQTTYSNNEEEISFGEFERLGQKGKLFSFGNDNGMVQRGMDAKTVTTKNIEKIIDSQSLPLEPTKVFVSWGTEQKVKRAFGGKTTYSHHTIVLTKSPSGEWTKTQFKKSRTM